MEARIAAGRTSNSEAAVVRKAWWLSTIVASSELLDRAAAQAPRCAVAAILVHAVKIGLLVVGPNPAAQRQDRRADLVVSAGLAANVERVMFPRRQLPQHLAKILRWRSYPAIRRLPHPWPLSINRGTRGEWSLMHPLKWTLWQRLIGALRFAGSRFEPLLTAPLRANCGIQIAAVTRIALVLAVCKALVQPHRPGT